MNAYSKNIVLNILTNNPYFLWVLNLILIHLNLIDLMILTQSNF